MPTVVRAQGGGEWDAALSRRAAKRRESTKEDADVKGSGSTSRRASAGAGDATRRRRSKGKKEAAPPLFPIRPPSPKRVQRAKCEGSGLGLNLGLNTGGGALQRANKMVRGAMEGARAWGWRGWFVAAVVVGVVGIGAYLGRRV
jgi:hypothetical protein